MRVVALVVAWAVFESASPTCCADEGDHSQLESALAAATRRREQGIVFTSAGLVLAATGLALMVGGSVMPSCAGIVETNDSRCSGPNPIPQSSTTTAEFLLIGGLAISTLRCLPGHRHSSLVAWSAQAETSAAKAGPIRFRHEDRVLAAALGPRRLS
jgi:hypothetical protein